MNNNKKMHLDRSRERELISKYQTTGKAQYIELLLNAHTAYITKIASQQYQKFGKMVEFDDLVQEGKIGLIKAIKKFKLDRESINPNNNTVVKNQALLTYAHSYILSEMQTLFHKSNAAHIPAHTIRAIQFKIKKPGCNTEERKALAKKAMRAESLDWHFDGAASPVSNESSKLHIRLGDETPIFDPTFEQSITHIYSPENQRAISMLSELEWKIVQMKLGLVPGEEGVVSKSHYIADELGITVDQVEKSFKKAKRILSKNLQKA